MISLKLKNIRSFSDYELNIDKKTTILVGKNSSGKSTIIESLYYCCFFKSFKTIKTSELIKFDTDNAYIKLIVEKRELKVNLVGNKVSLFVNSRETLKSEALNQFKCILISPEQIEIVNRGPSIRRDFINRNMSQINAFFLKEQMKYNSLIKQKNKLLKESSVNMQMYKVLTTQLKELNDNLVKQKIDYISNLKHSANKIIKWITDETETIDLNYKQVEVIDKFIESRELKYRSSVVGNHLDDIEILLNGRSLKKYGSQGQKRTVIISLILGHMDLMYQKLEVYPVVLIDDIHAELDATRQLKLQQLLSLKTTTIIAVAEKNMIQEQIRESKDTEIVTLITR